MLNHTYYYNIKYFTMATLEEKIKSNHNENQDNNEPEENQGLKEKKTSGSKGAMIHVEDLDEESSYSHVYLTAVYHNKINKLKPILKKQFLSYYGQKFDTPEELENAQNASFDEEFDDLELEEQEDKDEEDYIQVHGKKKTTNLFFYAICVMVLAASIQLTFIITLIQEYFGQSHVYTDDPQQIIIRILAFITLALYLWIELSNGRKILIHACYHGYLYRSGLKRLGAFFAGLIQCATSLCCLFCSSQLIVQSQTVADCVMNFTSLVIITDIDNYLGGYFLGTNKAFQVYSADQVIQIYVIKKEDYGKYSLVEFFIDVSCAIVGFISAMPIYNSVKFSKQVA